MFKIGNYPEGYDLTLLNTIYHKPSKQPNGRYSKDAIDLIIKDNATGETFLETIEEPTYDYFIIKPEYVQSYTQYFIEEEKTDRISVPFTSLLHDIAERTNNTEFFWNNIRNGNRSANSRLHTHPAIMCSDSDIEDHYRWKFSTVYQNRLPRFNKAFFDIEADVIHTEGDFVQPGECPINAVCIVDNDTLIAHEFLLRNENNPLIDKFENEVEKNPDEIASKFVSFITQHVGTDRSQKSGLYNLQIKFHFYTEEINLIKDLFRYINMLKPEFVLAWNMAFDIPYIIQRIRNLGYIPEQIMCNSDFKYREVKYFIDEENYNEPANRNDFAKISSYSVYLDQMIQFASRRKSGAALPNHRLDTIGEMTCGVRKYDYSHITTHIAELPYKDYETFVLYNIMDTIVQYSIEFKVRDIDNVYNNVLLNNTRYTKIYRQTVYLHNRAIKSMYQNGLIMCNNINKSNSKEKYPGGYVSHPSGNTDYSKIKLHNKPLSIYDNLDDFDYKCLYPSVESEFNVGPNTILAHLEIPKQVYSQENRFGEEDYVYKREGQFMADLQSHVWLEFFSRWFNLASYGEMYDDIIHYYTVERIPNGKLNLHNPDGSIPLFRPIPRCNKIDLFIPIRCPEDVTDKSKIKTPRFDFDKFGCTSFSDLYNSKKEN